MVGMVSKIVYGLALINVYAVDTIVSNNKTDIFLKNTEQSNLNWSTRKTTPLPCLERSTTTKNGVTNISCYSPTSPLTCFHDPLYCKKHFPSGKRYLEEDRPTYGEYSELDHRQWFYTIQHGGIAFLFHPCTDVQVIDSLRQLASECLHRYILAPSKVLTLQMPIALISWGCFYHTQTVNKTRMASWVRAHAYKGPASHVSSSGKYVEHLVRRSDVLTDKKDTIICPNVKQKNMFLVHTTIRQPLTLNKDPDAVINKRLHVVLHKREHAHNSVNITVTKIETKSAIWAAGSLIFLCGTLVGLLFYTRLWARPDAPKYDRIVNIDENRFEYNPSQNEFNLLKSSQRLISVFRKEKKDRYHRLDSMSRVHLLESIEEDEEYEGMKER